MKGDCYEIAVKVLFGIVDKQLPEQLLSSMTLCHGTVTGTSGDVVGEDYGHAWLECGDVCFDYANGREGVFPKSLYYSVGNVRYVKRYSKSEARLLLLATRHFGPWEEE